MMKKLLFAVLLTGFAVGFVTPVFAAEMSKKEAGEYLQQVMQKKVAEAGKKRLEKELTKIAPFATALYKRLAGIISAEQLAASLCWDLINLGLQNNEKKFAAEFAKSMRKYIPQEYTMGADAVNSFTEEWGFHVVTEEDCVTVLYELGKNTFDAISKMSAYEKQEVRSAGNIVSNFAAFVVSDLGGNPARMLKRQTQREMEARQEQNRQRMLQEKK